MLSYDVLAPMRPGARATGTGATQMQDADARARAKTDVVAAARALTPAQRKALAAKLASQRARRSSGPERGATGTDTGAPLSATQEQVWLSAGVAGGGAAYNAPEAVHFRGPLDLEAF